MQKLYFSISEISEQLGETANILRYWEKEFPILKPKKNRKGNRTYSIKDLIILKSIKKLLRDEMLTIKDAKSKLPEEIKIMESEVLAEENTNKPEKEIIETEDTTEVIDDTPDVADEVQDLTEQVLEENDEIAEEIEAIAEEEQYATENTDFPVEESKTALEYTSEDDDEDEPEEMFDITDSIQDLYNNYVEKDEILSFLDELLKKVKNL